jgi:hypothetical protein
MEVAVKNVTVAIDDATYTRARVIAAQRGTSVSRLVRDYLNRLDGNDSGFDEEWQALWRELDRENAIVGDTPRRERTYADAGVR